MMDCEHARATARKSVVICMLAKYGGMPHIGVCKQCNQREHSTNQARTKTKTEPCKPKPCRLTKELCEHYHGCSDQCRYVDGLIKPQVKSLKVCPKK